MNILLCGAGGRMGRAVAAGCGEGEYRVAAGVELVDMTAAFPVYKSIYEVREQCDVIIDFSHHSLLCEILAYAKMKKLPAVIAATGHTEDECALMTQAAEEIPIFHTGNMSLGINVLCSLARQAALLLGESFDVEIIEKHHHGKLDAPSGTALMIQRDIASALPYDAECVYDRTKERKKRAREEIGMHSIRGGSIVGEHEVLFCGSGEVISIKHSAENRELFASGALRAAGYITGKKRGIYSMKQLLAEAAKAAVEV